MGIIDIGSFNALNTWHIKVYKPFLQKSSKLNKSRKKSCTLICSTADNHTIQWKKIKEIVTRKKNYQQTSLYPLFHDIMCIVVLSNPSGFHWFLLIGVRAKVIKNSFSNRCPWSGDCKYVIRYLTEHQTPSGFGALPMTSLCGLVWPWKIINNEADKGLVIWDMSDFVLESGSPTPFLLCFSRNSTQPKTRNTLDIFLLSHKRLSHFDPATHFCFCHFSSSLSIPFNLSTWM